MTKKTKMILAGAGTATAVTALLVFLIWLIFFRSTIKGFWSYDDVSCYEFGDGGRGALVLPDDRFDFTYTLDEDKVSIDFDSKNARDITYTYKVSGSTLTLTESGGKSYELHKKEK